MYRTCIFCSAALGANEVVEAFPVGRSVAFDAAKGRLWAVCPRCARWNLAPIEERWEAVEEAERTFRDTRLRVQRENVGLAKLRDGTRLIRIGDAVPGEVAAWRYGRLMQRRRAVDRTVAAAAGAAGVALPVGAALGLLGPAGWFVGAVAAAMSLEDTLRHDVRLWWSARSDRKLILRLTREEAAGFRATRWLRKGDLCGAYLTPGKDGAPLLRIPRRDGRWVDLSGARATTALARSVTVLNARGVDGHQLDGAVRQISDAGSAEAWLARAVRDGLTLEQPYDWPGYWAERHRRDGSGGSVDDYVRGRDLMVVGVRTFGSGERYREMRAAALEIALNEETERRALEGELAELREMWRHAEEIAAIADALPDVPPPDPPRLASR